MEQSEPPKIEHQRARRHRGIKRTYEAGGRHAEYGLHEKSIARAQARANMLLASDVLPQPEIPGEKYILFSPSANRGVAEGVLQNALSESYTVIAGDLANVVKESPTEHKIQVNAPEVPFKDGAVQAIYDMGGAVYYEARNDRQDRTRGAYLNELLTAYRNALAPNGVLIIDDAQPGRTDGHTSSAEMLDMFYPEGRIDGFLQPIHIGEGETHMRVYRKAA